MLIAAIIAVVSLTAIVAAGLRWHGRPPDDISKIAARIDEQIAATNGRPHLPHVEVSPIDPPHNPAG